MILTNLIISLNRHKWFLIFGFLASIIFYSAIETSSSNQLISSNPAIRFLILYLTILFFGVLIGLISNLDSSKPIFWYGFLLGIYQFLIILIIVKISIIYFDIYADFSFAIGANMFFLFFCFFPMNGVGIFIGNKIKNSFLL